MATTTQRPSAVQLLEQQKVRIATLQERRTRLQVRLETERAALATASAEAIAEFETADLAELRQRFKDDGADNERVVMEVIMEVDAVEQQLADIERQVKL